MMVKDHTKVLNRLQRDQDTAQSGTAVLSLEHRELRDRLSELSGPDFDNAYMNAMIEQHKKDIREFETAAQSKPRPDDSTSDSSTVSHPPPLLRNLGEGVGYRLRYKFLKRYLCQ